MRTRERGGTLAECAVVAVVLIVIAALLVPGLAASRKQSKKRSCT